MLRKGLMVLTLGLGLSYSATVWFPVNEANTVPSLWQDGFLQGYKLGYSYCLFDTKQLKITKERLIALNLLIQRLEHIQSGKNVRVEKKQNYIEITIKIPKDAPSLIRLAKFVKGIEKEKELKGWIVYLDGSSLDEVKLGWYIRQAEKIGLNPIKIGKVVIFDAEPSKVDAKYIAQKLQSLGINGIKIAKID